MFVNIESTSPGRPLRFFLDESGTGLDRDHFILGGVAIYGEDEYQEALSAWRGVEIEKKGRKWTPAEFRSMVDFLLEHDVHPVACFVRLTTHLKEKLQARMKDLPLARERLGAPEDPRTVAPPWWLWYQVAVQLTLRLVELPRHFGKVNALTISPDPHNAPDWQKRALVAAASLIDEKVAKMVAEDRSSRTLDIDEVFECAHWVSNSAWGAPRVEFDPLKRSGLLEVADGYCALCMRDLLSDEDTRSQGRRIRERFYRTRHLLLADETSPILERIETTWEESWESFRKLFPRSASFETSG